MLAHHGEKIKFGSSKKKPALLEAGCTSQADKSDARWKHLQRSWRNKKEDQEWSGFQRLLDTES